MSFLTDFRLSQQEKNLGIYGVVVYQKGKIIAQHHFRSNDRINLYSASKTVAALGMGIAASEGRLALSDRVIDFFPEYRDIATEGTEHITVRHLLQMSSGHMAEDTRDFNRKDRAALFFALPMKQAAGTGFYYENNCTYMLGRIVETVSGSSMLNYLKPRIFEPLEIPNPQWFTCSMGHTVCSTGLFLTTEELSRVGTLLLNEGVYHDKVLVPSDFIGAMHTDLVDTHTKEDPESQGGYGYQVWRCTLPNSYRLDGMYGQFSVVLKDYDAVITVTAHNELEPKEILRAMWQDIVPRL